MVCHQSNLQKHPSRGVLKKRYSENMQQTYRRTPMPKFDFNKVNCHPRSASLGWSVNGGGES